MTNLRWIIKEPRGSMTDAEKEEAATKRRGAVAAEPTDMKSASAQVKVVSKTAAQKGFLFKAIRNNTLFSRMCEDAISTVVDAMFPCKTSPDEVIIKQGDDGDNFYVIEDGHFDATIDGKRVVSYENSGSFGELALMYNTPRAATITSKGKGLIWALDRATFRTIVVKNASNQRDMYEKLLESVTLLKSLNPYERTNVCDALVTREYKDGEAIINQGDPGKEMFFIEKGEVRIVMKDKGKDVELKRLKVSEYFGDLKSKVKLEINMRNDNAMSTAEAEKLALHTQKPRAASAFAVGNTKLAVLSIESFERLLGPCLHVMKRDKERYDVEGANSYGQLCTGDRVDRLEPTKSQMSGEGIKQVCGGGGHTLFLRNDGTVLGCGSNSRGQLGVADINNACQAVTVPIPESVRLLAAGWETSFAVSDTGKLYAWGSNSHGQLGVASSSSQVSIPTLVPYQEAITAIATGSRHSLAITATGNVILWGWNKKGQLGVSSETAIRNSPQLLPDVGGATQCAAGDHHSVLLIGDGSVVTWGRNSYHQLGHSSSVDVIRRPTRVSDIGAADLTCGSQHTLVLAYGTPKVLAWGWNEHGICGLPDEADVPLPRPVALPEPGVPLLIGCGAGTSFAVVRAAE